MEKYRALLKFFSDNCGVAEKDEQTTYYFGARNIPCVSADMEGYGDVLSAEPTHLRKNPPGCPRLGSRVYFDALEDLRIQLNNNFSKIWLKKGKIHDEQREEIEIRGDKNDFEKMEKLFLALGYIISIKWFRERYSFKWEEVDIALDFTRGYGYIIELEKMSDESHKEETTDYLKTKLDSLGIPLTTKEKFDEKYKYYKENWRGLV